MTRPTATACGPEPYEKECRCRQAVRRAFQELCSSGSPERDAYDAALIVFRWHHPEVSLPLARETVAAWVWNGVAH